MNGSLAHAFEQQRLWIRAGGAVDLFIELRRLVLSLLPEPGVAGVAHNGEQPGAAVPAPKPFKKTQGAEIGLLHQVFRIVLVAGQPARQIVGGTKVRQNLLLESRGLISGGQPLLLSDATTSRPIRPISWRVYSSTRLTQRPGISSRAQWFADS